MPTDRLRAVAAQVAALLDRAEPDPEPRSEAERAAYATAVAALRDGGVALLDAATPHLREYYEDRADACGEDNLGMTPLAAGDDVWEHVELSRPPSLSPGHGPPDEPSPCYVNFEGEVSWEVEHGLQLVFDHTGTVVRVGPYSGHLTNTGAFRDEVYGW